MSAGTGKIAALSRGMQILVGPLTVAVETVIFDDGGGHQQNLIQQAPNAMSLRGGGARCDVTIQGRILSKPTSTGEKLVDSALTTTIQRLERAQGALRAVRELVTDPSALEDALCTEGCEHMRNRLEAIIENDQQAFNEAAEGM